jgi:hypothetical protein
LIAIKTVTFLLNGDKKALESQFPIPTPEATVLVGTLDVFNETFDTAVTISPKNPHKTVQFYGSTTEPG